MQLTRRTIILAATASFVAPGLAAASAPPTSDGTTGWSFTDGSGRTVELDSRPERFVMHASAAAGLIPLGIRPVGLFADQPIESDPQLQGLDLSGIEIVGETWGVINLEAIADLDPDLIIGEYWPVEDAYSGLEPGTGGSREVMEGIAPIIGVAQGSSVARMIADYEAMAVALGADIEAPKVVAERDRFDAAVARFQDTVAAKPGLTVLAVSPTPEGLYVAVPEYSAELSDFVAWGLDVVVPEPDPEFPYWQQLSWEQANLYQADLIIVDDRQGFDDTVAVAEEQPTWQTLAAVQAGAVTSWPAFWLRNYTAYADALGALTDAIDAADPNLV